MSSYYSIEVVSTIKLSEECEINDGGYFHFFVLHRGLGKTKRTIYWIVVYPVHG